ncbi:MAG: hypothetical protein ACI31S_01505 [Bacilli bacterium]
MTEEEKKAIKSMKRFVEGREDMTAVTASEMKTLLNLLEKKDIDIIETKEANRQLSIELQKKDKIINLMEDEINKLLKDGFERIGLDVYLEKENITVREFIERKVESEEK